jgi:hypothetical protein
MLSQPRSIDESFLRRIAEIKETGASVTMTTAERYDGIRHVITRTATITWETHNAEAAAMPANARPIPYDEQEK